MLVPTADLLAKAARARCQPANRPVGGPGRPPVPAEDDARTILLKHAALLRPDGQRAQGPSATEAIPGQTKNQLDRLLAARNRNPPAHSQPPPSPVADLLNPSPSAHYLPPAPVSASPAPPTPLPAESPALPPPGRAFGKFALAKAISRAAIAKTRKRSSAASISSQRAAAMALRRSSHAHNKRPGHGSGVSSGMTNESSGRQLSQSAKEITIAALIGRSVSEPPLPSHSNPAESQDTSSS